MAVYLSKTCLLLSLMLLAFSACGSPKVAPLPENLARVDPNQKDPVAGDANDKNQASIQGRDGNFGDANADPNDEAFTETSPKNVIFSATTQVLQPLVLRLPFATHIADQTEAPQGIVFDDNDGRTVLYWLPQRQQAGNYKLRLLDGDANPIEVDLTVSSISDQDLQRNGPFHNYGDGDVGYIFIHGRTDTYLCNSAGSAENYWEHAIYELAPDATMRNVVCYDGTTFVTATAAKVAEQIIAANCGRFNKCIVVTHSMGGLVLEYILTHPTTDALFVKAKERLLFAISIASAAGGSKSADLAVHPERFSGSQETTGGYAALFAGASGSTKSLVVEEASTVIAPMTIDPQLPFFMVAGYSEKSLAIDPNSKGSILDLLNQSIDPLVFNGDPLYANIDNITRFSSMSDGIIAFRSGCGIQSDDFNDGPSGKTLADNFDYCFNAVKKPNHFMWFLTESNHVHIVKNAQCGRQSSRCNAVFAPNASISTLEGTEPSLFQGFTPMQVIRKWLTSAIANDTLSTP